MEQEKVERALKTRITELFGIEWPILSAPMVRQSGGTLAAAVSEAGGLGQFSGSNPAGSEWVVEQIHHIRALTDNPFGVGFLTHWLPQQADQFAAVMAEKVPVVSFSFADPTPWVRQARDNGALTVCQVQSIEGAGLAAQAGTDALAVQGNEAGGHSGAMTLMPLLKEVRAQFPEIPVLAAGGIGNGQNLATAMSAGAEGGWLGTAFLATPETVEITEAYKNLIVNSDGNDTVVTTLFDIVITHVGKMAPWPDDIAARVHRNSFTERWKGREDELRAQLERVAGEYVEAAKHDDRELLPSFMGPSAAHVHAIRPAGDVLRTICTEAIEALAG